jgi:hypothetical protein
MKVSSKLTKISNGQGDRTTQEQIRKRRHNLFRRLKEFNDRYDIEIWLTMRMPSGRIYIFATDPNIPAPSEEEIVSSCKYTLRNITDLNKEATQFPGGPQDTSRLPS